MKFHPTLFAFAGVLLAAFFVEQSDANAKMIGAALLGAALAKRPKMLPLPLPLPIPMKVEHKKYVPYKKPIPYYVHAEHKPV
ncbi:hypothetical protein NH340_JMT09271 [Sarcoptes scabiei]|nr:hypothetical protein NH340_JMT09271 [Sarcoptes scabiei]